MAEMDCRVLATIGLTIALVFLGGAIFLRQHDRHSNRRPVVHGFAVEAASFIPVEISSSEQRTADCPMCSCDDDYNDIDDANFQFSQTVRHNGPFNADNVIEVSSATTVAGQPRETNNQTLMTSSGASTSPTDGRSALFHLSEMCLQCICETVTKCQPVSCNDGSACGLFRISRPYWIDAGRPTLEGDADEDSERAYWHCVQSPYCSARAVAAFTDKYARDCNRDGVIDCYDFTAMHIQGPTGCHKEILSPIFENRLFNCLLKFTSAADGTS